MEFYMEQTFYSTSTSALLQPNIFLKASLQMLMSLRRCTNLTAEKDVHLCGEMIASLRREELFSLFTRRKAFVD